MFKRFVEWRKGRQLRKERLAELKALEERIRRAEQGHRELSSLIMKAARELQETGTLEKNVPTKLGGSKPFRLLEPLPVLRARRDVLRQQLGLPEEHLVIFWRRQR